MRLAGGAAASAGRQAHVSPAFCAGAALLGPAPPRRCTATTPPRCRPAPPGLYTFCKALEALETGLTGGFFFSHYCLATNVIGSTARGTMKRAVAGLKAGYETPVFPLLDKCRWGGPAGTTPGRGPAAWRAAGLLSRRCAALCRVALGARIDAEVAHHKGRMMDGLLEKYQQRQAAGCPFAPASPAPAPKPAPAGASPGAAGDGAEGSFEAARRELYSWSRVPPAFRSDVAAEVALQAAGLGLTPRPAAPGGPAAQLGGPDAAKPLALLDHAWGQMAPLAQVGGATAVHGSRAACSPGRLCAWPPQGTPSPPALARLLRLQYRAWREAAALAQLGNSAWDAMFGRVMPEAAAHVRALLGAPADACAVHFGGNSHELVVRLLSERLPHAAAGGGARPLRVLTSSTEFYSLTRQLNRFAGARSGVGAAGWLARCRAVLREGWRPSAPGAALAFTPPLCVLAWLSQRRAWPRWRRCRRSPPTASPTAAAKRQPRRLPRGGRTTPCTSASAPTSRSAAWCPASPRWRRACARWRAPARCWSSTATTASARCPPTWARRRARSATWPAC